MMPDTKTLARCLFPLLATTSLAAVAQTSASLAEQLQMAIAADDANKVAFILREQRYDPNFYLPNGDTPLVFAIRADATNTVNQVLLRSYKINVKVPTLRGETPLMLAAIKGNMALAQKLMDMGAPVNADYGWTALHYSASTGQHEMTRFLIEKGAKVNARTERGVTPLYMAARIVAVPTVEALLEAGADKTLCNDQGISPEAIARERGNKALADKLHIDQCAPWPPVATNTAENTAEKTVENTTAGAAEVKEEANATASTGTAATSDTQSAETSEAAAVTTPDAAAQTTPETQTAAAPTETASATPSTPEASNEPSQPEPAAPLFGPLGNQSTYTPSSPAKVVK